MGAPSRAEHRVLNLRATLAGPRKRPIEREWLEVRKTGTSIAYVIAALAALVLVVYAWSIASGQVVESS